MNILKNTVLTASFFIAFVFSVQNASAFGIGGVNIRTIMIEPSGDAMVYLDTSGVPSGSPPCSYSVNEPVFMIPAGFLNPANMEDSKWKNAYSTLLAAMLSGKSVYINSDQCQVRGGNQFMVIKQYGIHAD